MAVDDTHRGGRQGARAVGDFRIAPGVELLRFAGSVRLKAMACGCGCACGGDSLVTASLHDAAESMVHS